MKTIDNLKPCPFCGSINLKDCYVTIKCLDCGAEGPKMNGGRNDDHADYVDHEEAVNAWNARPGEDAVVAAEREKNLKLRKLVWLLHGDGITHLYGDDGEMQCTRCMIDFKRMSVDEIEKRLTRRNIERLTEAIRARGGE